MAELEAWLLRSWACKKQQGRWCLAGRRRPEPRSAYRRADMTTCTAGKVSSDMRESFKTGLTSS